MIDDHIADGDYVIVESREEAHNGEMVVALIDGESVTLKRFYQEGRTSVYSLRIPISLRLRSRPSESRFRGSWQRSCASIVDQQRE